MSRLHQARERPRCLPPFVLGLLLITTSLQSLAAATTPPTPLESTRMKAAPMYCPTCEDPDPTGCTPEVCDGFDNDCDDIIDNGVTRIRYRDADGDGKGAGPGKEGCFEQGWVTNNSDCDDSNASLWQWTRFYRDADADGFGAPGNWRDACAQPPGYVRDATDCNDNSSAIKPGALKHCGVGACAVSVQACVNGVESTCLPGLPSAEICDQVDNNCNGQTDDLPPVTCGVGICQRTVPACANHCELEHVQDGKPPVEVCTWGVNFCRPGNPRAEVCNGADDNCNGTIDDGVLLTFYRDADGDSFGAGAPIGSGCNVPTGASANSQDCNDTNAQIKPGSLKHCGVGACAASVQACVNGAEQQCTPGIPEAEFCDHVDNDCNGQVDDVPPKTCGVGICARSVAACAMACSMEEVEDGKPPIEVCEWGDNGVCTPGKPSLEICANGLDEDCNGSPDDSSTPSAWVDFYPDQDLDGYGATSGVTRACRPPMGTTRASGDCDDSRADMKPGAAEVCDGVDNNCSGTTDESGVCDQSICQ